MSVIQHQYFLSEGTQLLVLLLFSILQPGSLLDECIVREIFIWRQCCIRKFTHSVQVIPCFIDRCGTLAPYNMRVNDPRFC